jgi:hypothetical protein
MRNLTTVMKSVVSIALLMLGLGFSMLAFADESTDGVTSNDSGGVVTEQTTPSATDESTADEADSDASAASAVSDESTETDLQTVPDPQAIPDQQTPLIPRPYERGWALVNLLVSLLTIIIGVGLVGLSMVQRQRRVRTSNSFGLTVFGMAAAVISTILFTSTEDLQSRMVVVDGFTVIHLAVLAVSVLCVYLSVRKESQKEMWRSSD